MRTYFRASGRSIIPGKRIIVAFLTLTSACTGQTPKPLHPNNETLPIDASQRSSVQKEVLSPIEYNLILYNKTVDSTQIEVINAGVLQLPTGKIVACDPLTTISAEPFNTAVARGSYPVKLYRAKTKESGDRIALAKLEFSEKRAERWVLALKENDDVSNLARDEFLGFPVDAGLGCFADLQSMKTYLAFYDKEEKKNKDWNVYDDLLAKEFKKNAVNKNDPNDSGDWINFKIPGSGLNVAMFSSGYGDGVYPAYWGISKDNEIVSLVIDFQVLLQPK